MDHRRRQNVKNISGTLGVSPRVLLFFFLLHFDVSCDLLIRRMARMATWLGKSWHWKTCIILDQKSKICRFRRSCSNTWTRSSLGPALFVSLYTNVFNSDSKVLQVPDGVFFFSILKCLRITATIYACHAGYREIGDFSFLFFSNFLPYDTSGGNVPVKSKLKHSPRATPRAFEFLKNVCSNSPLPKPKSCSNALLQFHFRWSNAPTPGKLFSSFYYVPEVVYVNMV